MTMTRSSSLTTRSSCAAIALACALVFARSPASAAPSTNAQASADALFEHGQTEYKAGRYREAIPLFKEAYDQVHDPVYLFNIAQAYRKLFDCEPASDYYKQYLDALPTAENKAKVQQWLTELEPCVSSKRADRENERQAREREAARQAQEREHAKPPPPPQATTTEPADSGKTLRIAGIAAAAVGVVGLGVGAYYAKVSADDKNQVAGCTPAAMCNWMKYAPIDADGKAANRNAYIGFIGGGLVAAGGAVLYVLGMRGGEGVSVAPTAGGATVSTTIAF